MKNSGKLARQYMAALRRFLAKRNERALHQAFELGRRTIADGLGVIDMAKIHEQVLLSILPQSANTKESLRLTRGAGAFLAKSLSPFEMTHQGVRTDNETLRDLNEALEEKNQQLAATNQKLKNEIASRKKVEKDLRDSEEHYRELLVQARMMQENLRYLSCQILNVQEEERKRISRELHDEVGQALTAVNVNLAVLKKAVAGRGVQVRRKIKDAQNLLEQTMEAVHNFSRELRPPLLDDLGLIPALRSFVKNFSDRTGVPVDFKASPGIEQLEIDQKTVFYRVAQEGLTNVAKHAQATECSIIIRKHEQGFRMDVCDNGKAFCVESKLAPQTKGKNRLGLLGMQERVRLANGKCEVQSTPGKGTRLRIWIPLRIGSSQPQEFES